MKKSKKGIMCEIDNYGDGNIPGDEFMKFLRNCKPIPGAPPPKLMCVHAHPDICDDCLKSILEWAKNYKKEKE